MSTIVVVYFAHDDCEKTRDCSVYFGNEQTGYVASRWPQIVNY